MAGEWIVASFYLWERFVDDMENDAGHLEAVAAARQALLDHMPLDTASMVAASADWCGAAASIIGPKHVKDGTPRQDAFALDFIGSVAIGCVADGLGSQSRSHIGSKLASERVVADLVAAIDGLSEEERDAALSAGADGILGEVVKGAIIRAVRETEALMAIKPGGGFATTLVGVVTSPAYGFFFHVGDGIAIAYPADVMMPDQPAMLADQTVSHPENGDFDEITYAITANPDDRHLRFTPIENPRLVALMTDGPMPFAIAKDQESLAEGLFRPINAQLWTEVGRVHGGRILESVLTDVRAAQISDDDKTLMLFRHMNADAS
jgi:serine/threonine protein phosphatase PrpC